MRFIAHLFGDISFEIILRALSEAILKFSSMGLRAPRGYHDRPSIIGNPQSDSPELLVTDNQGHWASHVMM